MGKLKNTFAREEEAWWNDKTYMAEMDKRFGELETDKVKGHTLEGLEAGARQATISHAHLIFSPAIEGLIFDFFK